MPDPSPDPEEPRPARAPLDALLLLALWLVPAIGAVVLFVVYRDYKFEDAFITYRFAENIAHGRGYVFTPGEPVFGATSPLHTGVLTLCALLGIDVPTAAGVLTALGLAAVAVLGGLLLRRLGAPNAALFFAWFAVSGATATTWCWGLETALLASLVFGTFLAVASGRDRLAGVLVALAFLTRYDAAILAVLVFGFLALRRRRIPWGPGLIATAIAVPWLVFAQLYFGSVLPNTLGSKEGQYTFGEYLGSSLVGQLGGLWRPLVDSDLGVFQRTDFDVVLGIVVALLLLLGVASRARRQPFVALLLAFAVLTWCGYASIGPSVVYTWYLIPSALTLVLLAHAGLGALVPARLAPRARAVGALVAVGVLTALLPSVVSAEYRSTTHHHLYRGRVLAYEEIAGRIRDLGWQDDLLLTPEPGFLTYRSGNPVLDSEGLVTKPVFSERWPDRRMSIWELAKTRRPDLIVFNLWPPYEGYVPVVNAHVVKALLVRRDLHVERFDALRRDFEELSSATPPEGVLQHPFFLDVTEDSPEEWTRRGGHLREVRTWPRAILDGKPGAEPVIALDLLRDGAETPPFLIDFDRLEFLFTATHAEHFAAQLVVGGRVVLERGGLNLPNRGLRARPLRRESWPVEHWRGKVGRLRFLHFSWNRPGWLAADHVRSLDVEGELVLDDFEASESYGELWETGFGSAPLDLTDVAREFGVEFGYSARAAGSLGLSGKQTMRSKPFTIERDRLSLLVLDFGLAKGTSVRLLVDGEVVRRYKPHDARRLTPVLWDVSEWKGRDAVLVAHDTDPSPDVWIGIDDVVQTDG